MQRRHSERAAVAADLAVAAASVAAAGLAACLPSLAGAACPSTLAAASCHACQRRSVAAFPVKHSVSYKAGALCWYSGIGRELT